MGLRYAEERLKKLAEHDGWEVIHKGWPDFACIRGDETMFVEVKKYKGEMLKKHQHYLMTHFAKLGLKCYKWTVDEGFEQILHDTPFKEKPTPKQVETLTDKEWELATSLVSKDNWEIFKNMPLDSQRQILVWLKQGKRVRW